MEDILINLLSSFKYPVIRQGSLPPDEKYPDTFFTFWNNTETEISAYNNQTFSVVYNFDVNIYSNDPEKVYTLLRDARKLLKQNGWQAPERGHDLASDEITHTGRGIEVTYIQTESIAPDDEEI